MDKDNLKQIGELLKSFGVEFKFNKKKADQNTEPKQDQVSQKEPEMVEVERQKEEKEEGWTVIEKESQKKQLNPTLPECEASTTGPAKDATLDTTPPHTDARVETGFKEMQKMGFTNEGGWLIKLLEAKAGDITRTMEALKLE